MPDDPHPLIAPPLDWSAPPARLELPPAGVVDLWRIDLARPAGDVARSTALLSEEEIARADRYRFETHRARFVLGRAALREIIAGYCGLTPKELRFAVEPAGRPTLAHETCVSFSYSKTEKAAIVAAARSGRLGVDIEPVVARPDLDMIVGEQFSANERGALARLPEGRRLEAFYRGWTGREALVKATGEGLTSALPLIALDIAPDQPARLISGPAPYDPAVWSVRAFALGGGILGAVALDGPIKGVRAIVR